jgi:hypothetical protein
MTYLIFAEPVWHIPCWIVAAEFAPLALGLGWRALIRTAVIALPAAPRR